ncbi:MAG: hypothetical protein ABT940_08375 [Alphaproteobacteria bacterium]
METTFHNVTITIVAENPKAAYTKLCDMFGTLVQNGELEYTTDTFTTSKDQDTHRDSSEAFPNLEEE